MKAIILIKLRMGKTYIPHRFFLLLTFVLIQHLGHAQIKIGTNSNNIYPSSILELESQNKGLLFPRISDTVSINKLNPPDGTVIFFQKNGFPSTLLIRINNRWEKLNTQNFYTESNLLLTNESFKSILADTTFPPILSLNGGQGIAISGNYPNFTITNTKPSTPFIIKTGVGINYDLNSGLLTNSSPDQVIGLSGSPGISVTGNYPNFSIANTKPFIPSFIKAGVGISYDTTNGLIANSSPDQVIGLSGSPGISITGNYPNFSIANTKPFIPSFIKAGVGISYDTTNGIITNSAPDQILNLTGSSGISITGSYPNYIITSTGSSGNGWSFTGNTGTDPAVNFIGTSDPQPIRFRVNNRWIGEISEGNLLMGLNSGSSFSTALNNTFYGNYAGERMSVGNNNVLIGKNAGLISDGGSDNLFVGDGAGNLNTSGSSNIYLGKNSGLNQSSSGSNIDNNIVLGMLSGNSSYSSGASYNVLLGQEILSKNSNVTGSFYNNIIIGSKNLNQVSSIDNFYNNVLIGSSVDNSIYHELNNLNNNIILSDGSGTVRLRIDENGRTSINSALGPITATLEVGGNIKANLNSNVTNLAVFFDPSTNELTYGNVLGNYDGSFWSKNGDLQGTGSTDILGDPRTNIGFGGSLTGGIQMKFKVNNSNFGYFDSDGIFLGTQSGISIPFGTGNSPQSLFIGNLSGVRTTNGRWNVFLGQESGFFNDTGSYNLYSGYRAGYNAKGNNNTYLGSNSAESNSENTGSRNTFVGAKSGLGKERGSDNVAVGYKSHHYSQQDSKMNVAIGNYSGAVIGLNSGSFAEYNTTVGSNIENPTNPFVGKFNTLIGANITGSANLLGIAPAGYNTILGANVTLPTSESYNVILADGQGNIRYRVDQSGNTGIGIGLNTPTAKLEVGGSLKASLTNAVNSNVVYFNSTTKELTYGLSSNQTNYTAINTSTALNANMSAIGVTGTSNLTLPSAIGLNGKIFYVKSLDNNAKNIIPSGSELIDGATNYSLNLIYKYVTLISDGTQWLILSSN